VTTFRGRHDLRLLLRRLDAVGVDVPAVAMEARRLSPWAVEFRYGEVIDDDLDRRSAAQIVSDIIHGAEGFVG
jgi:hypothetical protein